MHKGFYAFIVFSAGACYGILSTFVKTAYAAGLTLVDVSGMQCLFGMVFLWLSAILTVRRIPSFFQILSLAAIGIPMALTTIFYYHSLESLSASLAVVFLFQSIWMGTAAESLIFKKLPEKKQLLSIILCLTGTLFLFLRHGMGPSFRPFLHRHDVRQFPSGKRHSPCPEGSSHVHR